jgi:diketogulonate reductase-like aldo/keto reductase
MSEQKPRTARIDRRTFLAASVASIASATLPGSALADGPLRYLTKPIPSTGVQVPVIGMGTWITFNVGDDKALRDARAEVLRAFFGGGGGLVDSSPMYGSSQEVLGYALNKIGRAKTLFAADKIWTRDGDDTLEQLSESRAHWNIPRFDLMQVHNLLAWEEHLPALRRLRASKKLGHIGITTSHGRRHSELADIMKNHQLDVVQLTYNPIDRQVEDVLLPLARERNIAIIANRPFRGGGLLDSLQRHPFPEWARHEADVDNWPQFVLKWIVSHPAVTCAIPATSKVEHMRENMGACRGRLPDQKTRAKMLAHIESL